MRLLVMNCHEPWIYQLRVLDADLDIVVGLSGRDLKAWDERMRPIPERARFLTMEEVNAAPADTWDCVIAHNITDLIDLKAVVAPTLLMIHVTLDWRIAHNGGGVSAADMKKTLAKYLEIRSAHAMGVSTFKAGTWGVRGDAVTFYSEPADYPAPTYEKAAGLRVANHVNVRRQYLLWDFHEAAFAGLPVTLIGTNPELGAAAASSWSALKAELAAHRFFIHTADPRYEDGYNMASIEAMAAGLPVIGNRHPTSPIKHGVTGFLARTPDELRRYAEQLLADPELARRMGEAAREAVAHHYTPSRFRVGMENAIATARRKFARGAAAQTASARQMARAGVTAGV